MASDDDRSVSRGDALVAVGIWHAADQGEGVPENDDDTQRISGGRPSADLEVLMQFIARVLLSC